MDFHLSLKNFTFSDGNGRAEVEKINSNGTLVCDDEAHKVVLSTRSPFLGSEPASICDFLCVSVCPHQFLILKITTIR